MSWTAEAYSVTTTTTAICRLGRCIPYVLTITYTVTTPIPAEWIVHAPSLCYQWAVWPYSPNEWNVGSVYYLSQSFYFYCQSGAFAFLYPWDWNPPTLPIWLWLRGGTNTLAPVLPIYVRVFNAYAEWFWSSAGLFIDLLILIALITPILARPVISRRLSV